MNYLENLLIYFSNLSAFYIFSVATSIAVVGLTIYLGVVSHFGNGINEKCDDKSKQQNHLATCDDDSDGSVSDSDDEDPKIESVRQLKSAKMKSLENTLTDEQRQAEREIERAQLAAIFDLLKKQNEEFHLGEGLDEEDLKEQLSLYR